MRKPSFKNEKYYLPTLVIIDLYKEINDEFKLYLAKHDKLIIEEINRGDYNPFPDITRPTFLLYKNNKEVGRVSGTGRVRIEDLDLLVEGEL